MAKKNIYAALKDVMGPPLPPGMEVMGPPIPTQKAIGIANRKAQPMPRPTVTVPAPAPLPEGPLGDAFSEANALRNSVGIGGARDSNSATVALDEGNKFGTTENMYMDPATMRRLSDAISSLPEMQAQKELLDRNSQYAADISQALPTGQVDISPMMALTDAWTGSKFASSYKAPDNMAGTKLLLDYGQKQAQALEDRNKMIMTAAQNMKSGTAQQQQTDVLKKTIEAGTGQAPRPPSSGVRNPLGDAIRYQKAFTAMPTYKDAQGGIVAANEVNLAMKNPNWLGDAQMKASILKTMKLFPVSDRDAKQITGSGDIASMISRTMGKLETGDTLTDEDRRTIEAYTGLQRKRSAMLMEKAKREFEAGMPAPVGYDRGSVGAILDPTIPTIEETPQGPQRESLMDMWKQFNQKPGK